AVGDGHLDDDERSGHRRPSYPSERQRAARRSVTTPAMTTTGAAARHTMPMVCERFEASYVPRASSLAQEVPFGSDWTESPFDFGSMRKPPPVRPRTPPSATRPQPM